MTPPPSTLSWPVLQSLTAQDSSSFCSHLADALQALALLRTHQSPVSLTGLAQQYLEDHQLIAESNVPQKPSLSLAALFEAHLKTLQPNQQRSRDGYRWTARHFCQALNPNALVDTLSAEAFRTALDAIPHHVTYNSLRRRLHAVIRWGLKTHQIQNTAALENDPRQVEYQEPCFFLPQQVERIFRIAQKHPGTPAQGIGIRLTLGFFAGMRTAEILRAQWEDIDADVATLRIPKPKGFSQGARPRLVELEPCAVAWIRYWQKWVLSQKGALLGPIIQAPRYFTSWKQHYLSPAHVSWGNHELRNIMRHSYATMHVAAFQNANLTALNLGHSHQSGMLERHYRGLVSHAVAKTYWKIKP